MKRICPPVPSNSSWRRGACSANFAPMRALLLLASLAVPATAWWLGSFTGLLIVVGACLALVAASFAFSTATEEAGESKKTRRAFGRSTTFLAGLGTH